MLTPMNDSVIFIFMYVSLDQVVNGTYNMQKTWIEQHSLGWNAWQAQRSAQEMFKRIFEMVKKC